MSQTPLWTVIRAATSAWVGRARVQLKMKRPPVARGSEDGSTGMIPIVDRSRFETIVNERLHEDDRHDAAWLCVLFVGVDGLGAINDSHGYEVGDAVLERTARRLRHGSDGLVAMCRVSGDEYALCLDHPPAEAKRVAAKLIQEFIQGVDAGGFKLRVGLSIGIAGAFQGEAGARLVRRAAIAMRSAKARGGAAYALFDGETQARRQADTAIARELRHAIARNQLTLVYQPKVDAVALQVNSVEVLLRWEHSRLGKVEPSIFIPIAERFGLMGAIGDWVMDHALKQAAKWRDLGLYMRVAINVSGQQLRRDDFAARLEQRLAQHDLPPSRFTCEITESVAVADSALARRAFARLRSIGVHVSVDDFGTGYSCLSSLCRLPVRELKLDRSFVMGMVDSADARMVVKSVVDMAHALHLRVVAEGVETAVHRDLMLDVGCDELQGYFFAKPMSAGAIAVWAFDHRFAPMREFRPSLFDDADQAATGRPR